jgi:hypothetical protein
LTLPAGGARTLLAWRDRHQRPPATLVVGKGWPFGTGIGTGRISTGAD